MRQVSRIHHRAAGGAEQWQRTRVGVQSSSSACMRLISSSIASKSMSSISSSCDCRAGARRGGRPAAGAAFATFRPRAWCVVRVVGGGCRAPTLLAGLAVDLVGGARSDFGFVSSLRPVSRWRRGEVSAARCLRAGVGDADAFDSLPGVSQLSSLSTRGRWWPSLPPPPLLLATRYARAPYPAATAFFTRPPALAGSRCRRPAAGLARLLISGSFRPVSGL